MISQFLNQRKNDRPRTAQELFNLRHAQARNVIERIFGAFKKRFRILHLGSEFPMHIQARIPAALAAIHNFIRMKDLNDEDLPGSLEDFDDHYERRLQTFQTEGRRDPPENLVTDANNPAQILRAQISQAMWKDYESILQERQDTDDYLYDDEDDEEDQYEDDEDEDEASM